MSFWHGLGEGAGAGAGAWVGVGNSPGTHNFSSISKLTTTPNAHRLTRLLRRALDSSDRAAVLGASALGVQAEELRVAAKAVYALGALARGGWTKHGTVRSEPLEVLQLHSDGQAMAEMGRAFALASELSLGRG